MALPENIASQLSKRTTEPGCCWLLSLSLSFKVTQKPQRNLAPKINQRTFFPPPAPGMKFRFWLPRFPCQAPHKRPAGVAGLLLLSLLSISASFPHPSLLRCCCCCCWRLLPLCGERYWFKRSLALAGLPRVYFFSSYALHCNSPPLPLTPTPGLLTRKGGDRNKPPPHPKFEMKAGVKRGRKSDWKSWRQQPRTCKGLCLPPSPPYRRRRLLEESSGAAPVLLSE